MIWLLAGVVIVVFGALKWRGARTKTAIMEGGDVGQRIKDIRSESVDDGSDGEDGG